MKRFSIICALLCLLFSVSGNTQIASDAPPFALTLDQVRQWSPSNTELTSVENVSSVPLVRRVPAPFNNEREQLDANAKVLYAPDGMNNFGSYLQTQAKFNLYNFTHWSQIDVFNWFAGSAEHSVHIPSRPWVETAHKNGVKVIGSVFFAPAVFGGKPDTVGELLEQDAKGHFIYADRLVEIASYYGFDGWLMNQETDLTVFMDEQNELARNKESIKRGQLLAEKMLAFMKYLTAKAPKEMEIHWYDSMLLDGRVVWQNELNKYNKVFLQDKVPSSDAIFLNYWWNRSMVEESCELANELGRSAYDVYFGVDLWPGRNAQRAFSKTQWLPWLFDKSGKKALCSIALFATNFNYNFQGNLHTPAFNHFVRDPNDYDRFYASEQRLFNGDDLNLAIDDTEGWPGIGRYLPAKTTIFSLPLVTSFNTGQGQVFMDAGKKVSGPWTNIGLQDVLPTWQFAVQGNSSVEIFYDFDVVYEGGSSLRIQGDASKGKARIPLYQLNGQLRQDSYLEITFKGTADLFGIYLLTASGEQLDFNFEKFDPGSSSQNIWQSRVHELSLHAGEHIVKVGIIVEKADAEFAVNLGRLKLR